PVDTPNLRSPDYFLNRELSALQFNRRVLHLAKDSAVPLLERLKFLCIVSTNLDEFFEIRISGLRQRQELGLSPQGPDLLSARQLLQALGQQTRELIEEQYRVLNDVIVPALHDEGIRFIRRSHWSAAQTDWLRDLFQREIEPVLSPTSLDP